MNPDLAALAKSAGLDVALVQFPDDVAAAAAQALRMAAAINTPPEADAEPWPPMRPGSDL